MPESRMEEVATELLRQSNSQNVNWEETIRRFSHGESYRVIFPDVALIIDRIPSLDEEPTLTLSLVGETGREVDSLSTGPSHPMHSTLSDIFDLAEQHVRDSGINKALEYLKRS